MKKIIILLSALLLHSQLWAQKKIDGVYYPRYHTFTPTDRNVLVQYFGSDNLAPFMIKGRDPFNADSNRVGFIDTTGRVVVKPLYNNCSFFNGNYALVMLVGKTYRDNKFGIINRKGKTVIPLVYQRLSKCQNGLYAASLGDKMGFINIRNKVIVPFGKYSGYAVPPPVYREGDDEGHMEFRWEAWNFTPSVFFKKYLGVRSGKKWAVIDSTGAEIIPPKFDGMGIFTGNLAPAAIGKKFGVTDTADNMVIPALYDRVDLSGKDYLFVHNGEKTGVLSLGNKLIIPIEFKNVDPFGDGFTAYGTDGQITLFDADGAQVCQAKYTTFHFPFWRQDNRAVFVYNKMDRKFHSYQDVQPFERDYNRDERLFFYKRDDRWGLIDSTAREITPPLYDGYNQNKLYLLSYSALYAAVITNDKWGLIDTTGKLRVDTAYDELIADHGKLFGKKGGKCGFFNADLQPATPMKYDSLVIVYPLDIYNPRNTQSVIRARIGNKWGLIDYDGKEIVPFVYDELLWVYNKLALVKNNGKYGIVNLQGKLMADCVYDEINFNDQMGAVNYINGMVTKQDGRFGLLNRYGTEVAAPVYEKIIPLFIGFQGKYQVTQNGKKGMIDGTYGKLMIPCIYDDLKFYNDEGAEYYGRNWQAHYSPYITAIKDGYSGLIDTLGKVRLPIVYDRVRFDPDGYYINMDSKQGVLNKDLKWIVPPEYYYVDFDERDHFYITHTFNASGLVSTNCDLIFKPGDYEWFQFCGDTIIVKKDGKFGTLAHDGKIIDDCVYDNIECRNGQLVKTSGKKGG